jgi:hypothetical protein
LISLSLATGYCRLLFFTAPGDMFRLA